VKYGDKYVSIRQDDPYTITLERAIECIRAKQHADANRIVRDFGTDGIQVLNGRYGPYISDGTKNARSPKGREPTSLTLEECRALLAAAPLRGQRFRKGARGKAAAAPAPARETAAAESSAESAKGKSARGDAGRTGKAVARAESRPSQRPKGKSKGDGSKSGKAAAQLKAVGKSSGRKSKSGGTAGAARAERRAARAPMPKKAAGAR
jgi:DNA topoisomerase-1